MRVSSLFKKKIYAAERSIKATISFELLDAEAYEHVTVSVNEEATHSRAYQITNMKRESSFKYATFERDYFQLDGSFYIPPKPNESLAEVGWWSNSVSDGEGVFANPPMVTFDFTEPISSIGLTLTFDKNTNEYPSDFEINVFGEGDVQISHEVITGNENLSYYFDKPLDNYTRVEISILKWSKPYRRARLIEVDFGVVWEYTGDKLISLKILEEIDLLASTVPSNEIEIVLDNSDQYFNILNPNGVYRFLEPNQIMKAKLGLLVAENKIEWIDMGVFYLDEWIVEEGSMTSTFTGRDIFTRLDDLMYTTLLQNTNLYDLAESVLLEAKIKNYKIDSKLKNINTIGFKEPINIREALQMIAIASRSVVRQNRQDFLVFEQYEKLAFTTGYINFVGGEYAGLSVYPQVHADYSFQVIDFNNAYEVPKISLNEKVTHLIFKITDSEGIVTDYRVNNPNVKDGIGYEINNPLINSEDMADEIAEWMFSQYNFIAHYQANWRQNPALECGNVALIEDNFGNKRKARITKQEFNYQGYLSGTTEAKGGV